MQQCTLPFLLINQTHITYRCVIGCEPGYCKLEVHDDGVGFSLADVGAASQGLFRMRHRVEARGGIFDVTSAPQHGTRVRAIIPVPNIIPATLAVSERAHFLDLARA